MPTFKIDGREVPFEAGDTILRAAWRAGIEIPHYCWHPGLSVAANCRMCLVEITSGRPMPMPILRWDDRKHDYVPDTKPKLQPACQMAASEALEVRTDSATVQETQAGVQEKLLLNHPVDCPICDQAGECKLQDYWLAHQHRAKRKLTEPVHKPKAVRFGPTIVYDAERCILCTRCMRVCDELVGDHVLDMRQRGNQNEIFVAPGRELDHRYALMTEHVCPVGALTSRDFRFKARVWVLRSAPGVCVGCSTGCNTHVDFDPRYGRVYRLRPRDNADVNRFWMCDDGMMTYRQVHDDRVLAATVGRGSQRRDVSQDKALQAAAKALAGVDGSKVAVVLSAHHSSEDNLALARLAGAVLGTQRLYVAALEGWEGDAILRHADNNPNRAGALAAAGGKAEGMEDLIQDALGGEIEAVVALGWASPVEADGLAPLGKLAHVIWLSSNGGPMAEVASVTVPVSSWAETHGTFVNADGLAQRFRRAIPSPGAIRSGWETVAALAAAMGKPLPFSTLESVRAALGQAAAPAAAEARA